MYSATSGLDPRISGNLKVSATATDALQKLPSPEATSSDSSCLSEEADTLGAFEMFLARGDVSYLPACVETGRLLMHIIVHSYCWQIHLGVGPGDRLFPNVAAGECGCLKHGKDSNSKQAFAGATYFSLSVPQAGGVSCLQGV